MNGCDEIRVLAIEFLLDVRVSKERGEELKRSFSQRGPSMSGRNADEVMKENYYV